MTISFDKEQTRKIELWAIATGNKLDDKAVLSALLAGLVTEKLDGLRVQKGEVKP
jgi:hypothetical protein